MQKLKKNDKKRLALTGILVLLAILEDTIGKIIPDSRMETMIKAAILILIVIVIYIIYILDKPCE